MKQFIFFLLSFLIVMGCEKKTSMQNQEDKAIKAVAVIFIQADYDHEKESEKEVFYGQLNYLVGDALKKRFKEDFLISSIIAYPLDGHTKESRILSKIENLDDEMEYDREVKIDDFFDRTYNEYKSNVETKKELLQDIVGSYSVLKNNNDFFKEYKNINIIYLSDMVHYNVEHDHPEIENGYTTFTKKAALEAFRHQVTEGKIITPQGKYELKELFPNKYITVTVIKPRKKNERENYDMVKHLDIDGVWRHFFKKCGVDEIKINM